MRVKQTRFPGPAWVTRGARRSLALALLLALLWMGSRAAFALSADAGEPGGAAPVYHFTESFNPQGGAMPFTIIDQRPDPLAASTKAASQVWGSQLNLALNLQSSLASSVYFSRSLPLYEALRNGNLFGDDDSAPGFLALRGPGAGHVLDRGSRSWTTRLQGSSSTARTLTWTRRFQRPTRAMSASRATARPWMPWRPYAA